MRLEDVTPGAQVLGVAGSAPVTVVAAAWIGGNALRLTYRTDAGTTAHVSPDTRWCVEWFKQYGFDQGPFGTAETLSKGIDTSIDGLERAGVLVSRAGKVKLRYVPDLPDVYDPREDERTSEWEICLHLARQLDGAGADAAASLMAACREIPGVDLDDVRELAYLLYSIAEKKGWAEIALLFNNLGTSWTDIEDLSRKAVPGSGGVSGQGEFALEFGSGDDGDE